MTERCRVLGLVAVLVLGGSQAAAQPAPARERVVRCVVAGADAPAYRGRCRFLPDGGGSFSLRPGAGRAFPGGTSDVSIHLIAPGQAEVRGLTTGGINSRWGEARRSTKDRACWEGSDFRVCAY